MAVVALRDLVTVSLRHSTSAACGVTLCTGPASLPAYISPKLSTIPLASVPLHLLFPLPELPFPPFVLPTSIYPSNPT